MHATAKTKLDRLLVLISWHVARRGTRIMILRGIHIICLQTTFSLGFCNSQAGTGVYMRITSLFSCDQGKELSITCATCPLIAELHRMKAAPKLTTQRQGIERIYNRTRGIDASGAQLKLFPCHWNMQSPCQPKASFLGCVLCSQKIGRAHV